MDNISIAEYRNFIKTDRKSALKDPSKPKRATPEEDLHRACMEWVGYNIVKYPILKWMMHVPNGGKRSPGEAGKMKALGVNKGFPDLSIPLSNGKWKGFGAELKSPTGRLTDDQNEWAVRLDEDGWLVCICRTLDSFLDALTAYLESR